MSLLLRPPAIMSRAAPCSSPAIRSLAWAVHRTPLSCRRTVPICLARSSAIQCLPFLRRQSYILLSRHMCTPNPFQCLFHQPVFPFLQRQLNRVSHGAIRIIVKIIFHSIHRPRFVRIVVIYPLSPPSTSPHSIVDILLRIVDFRNSQFVPHSLCCRRRRRSSPGCSPRSCPWWPSPSGHSIVRSSRSTT